MLTYHPRPPNNAFGVFTWPKSFRETELLVFGNFGFAFVDTSADSCSYRFIAAKLCWSRPAHPTLGPSPDRVTMRLSVAARTLPLLKQ